MKTIVNHFWIRDTDGRFTLYEADYAGYPLRDGVLCYRMLPHSERPCTCAERERHEQRLVATLN